MATDALGVLATRYAADAEFRNAFDRAATPRDAVEVAAAFGLTIAVEDLASAADRDLSDSDLEFASAGAAMTDPAAICWTLSTCIPYCPPAP